MARYIDAERLIESLELSIKSWGRDCNSNAPKMVMAYQDVLYRLKKMLVVDVVSTQELDQALQDKARGCNIAIDKICLEHREEIRTLQEKHEAELAKAKSEIASKIIRSLKNWYFYEDGNGTTLGELICALEKKYTEN